MNSTSSFWLIVAIILIVSCALLFLRLRRSQLISQTRIAASEALRDAQLTELDESLASGQIDEGEANGMRKEIERAYQRAARRGEDRNLSNGSNLIAGSFVLVAMAAAVVTYIFVGWPGLEDFGAKKRADLQRPSQELAIARLEESNSIPQPVELDSETQDLLKKLKVAINENPEIAEGYKYLHTLERAAGNLVGAYKAQQKYIELSGEKATAEDYALLAEEMVLSTHGYVSPEAEDAIRKALKMDANNQVAQFYMAITMKQEGALEQARDVLTALKNKIQNRPEWQAEIDQQIADIEAKLANSNGPSAAQIEDAANLSDADREAMIGGMVDGLKSRLAQSGGEPEEWVRLITSLRVLGRTTEADAILSEAMQKFPQNADILALR